MDTNLIILSAYVAAVLAICILGFNWGRKAANLHKDHEMVNERFAEPEIEKTYKTYKKRSDFCAGVLLGMILTALCYLLMLCLFGKY